jgi:hypothetical protein
VTRLYQWLHDRATSFYAWSSSRRRTNTLRTQITVQQQERTLLVCGHGQVNAATCPLCGQALSGAPDFRIEAGTEVSSATRSAGCMEYNPPQDTRESPAGFNQTNRGSLK